MLILTIQVILILFLSLDDPTILLCAVDSTRLVALDPVVNGSTQEGATSALNSLCVAVNDISGEINLLRQLSNTIRKASGNRRNLMAAASFQNEG